jgi:hypothetical protein
MNQSEWNKTASEQNAKAEQIGAGIAVGGCLLFILAIVILIGIGAMLA